jgi:hypothetical protein
MPDILKIAKERFKRIEDYESIYRDKSINDIEFANENQWDERDKSDRELKRRPCLTVNKIAGVLKTLRGHQRQLMPSIKVRPVDSGADPEVAKIMNGLIRNIEYASVADSVYSTAFNQAIEGGWGFFRIGTRYCSDDTFDQEIYLERIPNQFTVYIDPDYIHADASDIKWAFITKQFSEEDFKKKYPKSEMSSWSSDDGRRRSNWWGTDYIKVAEYYYIETKNRMVYELSDGRIIESGMRDDNIKDGFYFDENGYYEIIRKRKIEKEQIYWCELTDSEVLTKPMEVMGNYIPIVLVPGEEVNIDGKRYYKSAHHYARDAQLVYNWMVSTAVETVAMAPKTPWLVTEEQVAGYENQWDVIHQDPKPYVIYRPDPNAPPPSRQQGGIPDTGAIAERNQAAEDIKATTGVYNAALGMQGNERSASTLTQRQTMSDMATYIFMDNLRRSIVHAGKIIVNLIPRVYDSERTIRILGDDGTEEFVEINAQGLLITLNDLTVGKYDVVVTVGEAYATKRLETVKYMTELFKTVPDLMTPMMDILMKNMDFPGADQIAARLETMAQQPKQMSEEEKYIAQAREIEAIKAQLDIQGKQIDNQKDMMDLQNNDLERVEQMPKLKLNDLKVAEGVQDIAIKADKLDMENEDRIIDMAERISEKAIQERE